MFKQYTTIVRKIPGQKASQGACCMYSLPSRLSIPPQLGISTGRPNPRKLSHNQPPDVDREDDDDRGYEIRQDMADQDLACRVAHGPGGQKIVILFDADHHASHDSGTADAAGDPQDDDDLEETLSHDGHDG